MSEPGKPADENADVRRELVVPSTDAVEANDGDRSPTKTDQELMPTDETATTGGEVEVVRKLVIPEQLAQEEDGDRSPTKTERDLKIE